MKKKEYKIANGESVETFWLDGFEGYAKCGAFFRSRIHIDINEFESKFDEKVIGIGLRVDSQTLKPSWNVEFILMKEENK